MTSYIKENSEPLIHSHREDCLPTDHPLAHETVFCDKCGDMVHAANNECMDTWVELPDKDTITTVPIYGNFCLRCFTILELE